MGAELCSNRAVATVDAWFMVVDQAETTFDDSQELQQKMFIIKILCVEMGYAGELHITKFVRCSVRIILTI